MPETTPFRLLVDIGIAILSFLPFPLSYKVMDACEYVLQQFQCPQDIIRGLTLTIFMPGNFVWMVVILYFCNRIAWVRSRDILWGAGLFVASAVWVGVFDGCNYTVQSAITVTIGCAVWSTIGTVLLYRWTKVPDDKE